MRTLSAALAALVATIGLTVPTAHAEPGDYRLRVITHNLAGGPINHGTPRATQKAGTGRISLATLEAQMDSWHPDFIGLQEVCETQLAALREDYPSWTFEFQPLRTVPHTSCTYGGVTSYQGQIIGSPWPLDGVTVTDLPHDAGVKNFTLLCADVHVPALTAPMLGCTTHLMSTTNDALLADQTAAIRTALPLLPGRTTVLTCDCNSVPTSDQMDNLYRLRLDGRYLGPGVFREADETDGGDASRGGDPTEGSRKLDYVFISRNTADPYTLSGGIVNDVHSDHEILRGAADVTP